MMANCIPIAENPPRPSEDFRSKPGRVWGLPFWTERDPNPDGAFRRVSPIHPGDRMPQRFVRILVERALKPPRHVVASKTASWCRPSWCPAGGVEHGGADRPFPRPLALGLQSYLLRSMTGPSLHPPQSHRTSEGTWSPLDENSLAQIPKTVFGQSLPRTHSTTVLIGRIFSLPAHNVALLPRNSSTKPHPNLCHP